MHQLEPHVPAPFAELTGYDYPVDVVPDEEVYYRRLHFGALQPAMAHTPYFNADPWRRDYGRAASRATPSRSDASRSSSVRAPSSRCYRIARWGGPPESVGAFGATVTVNQGGEMADADSEVRANGTDASSWFYDTPAQRLIIKVVP
jgi:hypothetical protein